MWLSYENFNFKMFSKVVNYFISRLRNAIERTEGSFFEGTSKERERFQMQLWLYLQILRRTRVAVAAAAAAFAALLNEYLWCGQRRRPPMPGDEARRRLTYTSCLVLVVPEVDGKGHRLGRRSRLFVWGGCGCRRLLGGRRRWRRRRRRRQRWRRRRVGHSLGYPRSVTPPGKIHNR